MTNFGNISGVETGVFAEGRSFTNAAGGVISGSEIGLAQKGGGVQNEGLISGTTIAAGLYGYGSFSNSGTVFGGSAGFVLEGTVAGALLQNSGQIAATGIGVLLDNGTVINGGTLTGLEGSGVIVEAGTLINSNSIAGNVFGVEISSGVLYDSGTITGGEYAVEGLGAFNLVLNNTGVLNGKVIDKAGDGEIDLVGASGTLSGLGSSITGFNSIFVDLGSGAGAWTLEGDIAGLASGQSINGLTFGDVLELGGFAATSDSYVYGTGLVLSNTTASETLNIGGNFSTNDFIISTAGDATQIELTAPCFCAGTRIATVDGNVPVELLRIGDLVKTAAHGARPVKWIGTRSYDGRFIAGNHRALPVRIRRHALGFNVPSRDLFVSPDHAICEGGVLVHAWRLVNGVSITQAPAVERVDYFNIELDSHDVIFAENTAVESFLDTNCRDRYQNAAEFAALYPNTPVTGQSCLPLVEYGFYLARIKERIDRRAGLKPPMALGHLRGSFQLMGAHLTGWAQNAAAPDWPVELEILWNGQSLTRLLANQYRAELRRHGSGCHAFDVILPPVAGSFLLRRVADGVVLEEEKEPLFVKSGTKNF